jgi:SAM-dependent methyltransferase
VSGAVTADGCPVEVYRRLPALGEAAVVSGALAPGASVLDLGCGVGRIAHELIALGHPVVAVDQSAEMLAFVHGAETVCAPIAGLELGRTFDGVLLVSHLVNTPAADDRAALWAAARRHLAPGGRVVVEWHPPAWFDTVRDGVGSLGDVEVALTDVVHDGELLSAVVRYRLGDDQWAQPFTARRLTEQRLGEELTAADLLFDRWLSDDNSWFAAGLP